MVINDLRQSFDEDLKLNEVHKVIHKYNNAQLAHRGHHGLTSTTSMVTLAGRFSFQETIDVAKNTTPLDLLRKFKIEILHGYTSLHRDERRQLIQRVDAACDLILREQHHG